MIISELRKIIGGGWVAQAKNVFLCTMYVRKKPNRSGSTSVVVVSKASGKYKELKSFGSSTSEEEIDSLYDKVAHGYVHWAVSKNLTLMTAREKKLRRQSVFLAISTAC